MKKEVRTVCYDEQLRLEAYRFEGVVQSFPNHFHEHYVIGVVEAGVRRLTCRNREYDIGPGDILLFAPGDSHGCQQRGGTLDYRALNIPKETMVLWTGEAGLPEFPEPVIHDAELAGCLRSLHQLVMDGEGDFEKEELLLLLLSALTQRYGQRAQIPECREQIERACAYMEQHYAEKILLTDLCRCSGLSKSTLLREFTRAKGVTPYRYLQTVRVNRARELLEQGMLPVEAAMRTGFSDQSHFTRFFRRFIGLSPAAYRNILRKD